MEIYIGCGRVILMTFKVKLAKIAMNLLPSKPTHDITRPRSETVNHKVCV